MAVFPRLFRRPIVLLVGAYALALLIAGNPRVRFEAISGHFYWSVILHGWGRVLHRGFGRVYFYWQGRHGRNYHHTSYDQIEAFKKQEVVDFVDFMLSYDKGNGMGPWRLKRFCVLTGYAPAQHGRSPTEWWHANKSEFTPSDERITAYLAELETQARLYDRRYGLDRSEDGEFPDDGLREDTSLRFCQDQFSKRTDRMVRRWRLLLPYLFSAGVETLHFAFLAFLVMHVLPAVRDRWTLDGSRLTSFYAFAAFWLHLAFVLPLLMGYGRDWLNIRHHDQTIFYAFFLCLFETPAHGLLWILPKTVVDVLSAVAYPFRLMGLSRDWANEPALILLGTIIYTVLGGVAGLKRERRRRRTARMGKGQGG